MHGLQITPLEAEKAHLPAEMLARIRRDIGVDALTEGKEYSLTSESKGMQASRDMQDRSAPGAPSGRDER